MTSRSRKRAASLAGTTILIVEDEFFVALELSAVLKSFGATVLGPVGRLDDARKLVIAGNPNAAVLDVKLDGELSLALAQELAATDVAIVLLSGYDRDHLPEGYDHIPLVIKPVTAEKLLDTLRGALNREVGGFIAETA